MVETTQRTFVPKVRLADPTYDEATWATSEQACSLRTHSKFTQALQMLREVHDKEPADSIKRTWLLTQILKTQYMCGQFVEGLDTASNAIDAIDAKFNILESKKDRKWTEEESTMRYYFFKLILKQA